MCITILDVGVLSTAAGVAKDQADADEDMSLKQRLVLAGGSALEGASEMVDNEIVAGAMEVAGDIIPLCCSCIYLYRNTKS